MVYLGNKEQNEATLPKSAQRKHEFLGKKGNFNNKQVNTKEENCFRIVAPEIISQIHQIIVVWGYC